MGSVNKSGFTIIETMLFLGITGLLVVSLLAGAGTSINIQRYRDSVSTLQSTLQQQYVNVVNVSNDRSASLSCDANAQVVNSPSPVGQSDCVLMGKYITIVDNVISISTVVGASPVATSYSTDINELQAYKLSVDASSTVTTTLEWGARIAWATKGLAEVKSPTTPRTIALLIVRDPTSGLNYTFSSDDTKISLHGMILPGNTIPGQSQRRICVDSNGLFAGGLAILINQNATGANDIQVRSNDMGDTATC